MLLSFYKTLCPSPNISPPLPKCSHQLLNANYVIITVLSIIYVISYNYYNTL